MRTRGDKRRSVEALAWDAWCVYREVKHEKYVARRKHLEKVVKVGWAGGVWEGRKARPSLVFVGPRTTRTRTQARGQRAGEVSWGAGMRAGRRVGAEALSHSNAKHERLEASIDPLDVAVLLFTA